MTCTYGICGVDADANTRSVWYLSVLYGWKVFGNNDITLFILDYDSRELESCCGTTWGQLIEKDRLV